MRLFNKLFFLALLSGVLLTPAYAQEVTLEQNDILNYLEELINWQRDAVALDPGADNAREVIFQNTLKQNSAKVLQSGFKFARTEAAHQSEAQAEEASNSDEPAPEQTPRQRITQRAEETQSRIDQIETRLSQLDPRIAKAPKTMRLALEKERGDLQDELKLAEAKKELFQSVLANISAAAAGESKGFLGKINNLASTLPELSTVKAPKEAKSADATAQTIPSSIALLIPGLPNTATPATTPAVSPRPVTSILSLASNLFDITREQRALKDFILQTTHLEQTSKALIKTLREAMDHATAPADQTPQEATAVEHSDHDGDPSAEQADTHTKPAEPLTIDKKIAEFKKIAADIVPLGDATLWVGMSKRAAQDWQNLLEQQMQAVLRSLAIHLGILAIAIAIPLLISSALKRAIKRYVMDPKRQRQAQTGRRILTWLIIVFIVLQNFISDFSSFATFAGFLTAGLAVALQSVLLSLVAHFLFYGRYGVRSGDRVSVAGVTGDILQIGVMRFYLRELTKSGDGFAPTGKVVAFPNSILFQPAAFYKYV